MISNEPIEQTGEQGFHIYSFPWIHSILKMSKLNLKRAVNKQAQQKRRPKECCSDDNNKSACSIPLVYTLDVRHLVSATLTNLDRFLAFSKTITAIVPFKIKTKQLKKLFSST